jgi:hypothetical protein
LLDKLRAVEWRARRGSRTVKAEHDLKATGLLPDRYSGPGSNRD